jgi:hypothetical protein
MDNKRQRRIGSDPALKCAEEVESGPGAQGNEPPSFSATAQPRVRKATAGDAEKVSQPDAFSGSFAHF